MNRGHLGQWLWVWSETRHMQAVLRAQINKTDPQRCARHRTDDAGGTLPFRAYAQ